MNILDKIRKEQVRAERHEFAVGDTIRIHVKIVEGDNERIQQFQGTVIARHGSGMTRINVGQLVAGEGRNVIPSHAVMKMEVRGETGEINQYMYDSAVNIIKGCALSQNCEYTIEKMGEAVDLTNDPELVKVLTEAVGNVEGMTARQDPMNFGGSEDATILARRVQAHGGKAAFFVLGADRPSGHHTAKFDIDEKALDKGLAVWANAIKLILK